LKEEGEKMSRDLATRVPNFSDKQYTKKEAEKGLGEKGLRGIIQAAILLACSFILALHTQKQNQHVEKEEGGQRA
jgi:hypothetical protein